MEFRNLDDLRTFVHQAICEQHELEVNVFRISERVLIRSGKPCGLFFCLHGPRSVKLTAIWETEGNSILFYGSGGERVHRIELSFAPTLKLAAA